MNEREGGEREGEGEAEGEGDGFGGSWKGWKVGE